jgi:hypothetical protein
MGSAGWRRWVGTSSRTSYRSPSSSTVPSGSAAPGRACCGPARCATCGGRRKVALVVDDLPSLDPFIGRGIRVYGMADGPVERVGMVGPGYFLRITRRSSGAGPWPASRSATPGTRRDGQSTTTPPAERTLRADCIDPLPDENRPGTWLLPDEQPVCLIGARRVVDFPAGDRQWPILRDRIPATTPRWFLAPLPPAPSHHS